MTIKDSLYVVAQCILTNPSLSRLVQLESIPDDGGLGSAIRSLVVAFDSGELDSKVTGIAHMIEHMRESKGFDSLSKIAAQLVSANDYNDLAGMSEAILLGHLNELEKGLKVMSEQRTVTQTITPSMAKSLLSNNKSNRPISKAEVSRYARDMIAGNWVMTHQGILIGKDGALIDGQHRLSAVVSSGVSVKMPVTYDDTIATPLQLPLDTGRKRAATSSLNIPTSLSAVANLSFRFVTGTTSPTLSELKRMVDLIEPYHGLLSKSTRKGITSGVMLGAIVQMMRGNDVDYCINTYDGFVNDYKTLDPYPASLFNQLVVDRVSMDAYEIFGRAIRVFDSSNKWKTRVQFKNRDLVISEAIDICKSAFMPLLKS